MAVCARTDIALVYTSKWLYSDIVLQIVALHPRGAEMRAANLAKELRPRNRDQRAGAVGGRYRPGARSQSMSRLVNDEVGQLASLDRTQIGRSAQRAGAAPGQGSDVPGHRASSLKIRLYACLSIVTLALHGSLPLAHGCNM